jgi:hypothetical protein
MNGLSVIFCFTKLHLWNHRVINVQHNSAVNSFYGSVFFCIVHCQHKKSPASSAGKPKEYLFCGVCLMKIVRHCSRSEIYFLLHKSSVISFKLYILLV